MLPARIGAERVAELLLYRDMTKLIARARAGSLDRLAVDLQSLGLEIEVTLVEAGSRCAGATIAEIEKLGAGTVLVVALERSGGETILQPPAATVVEADEGLAVIHRTGRIETLVSLFAAETSHA